jgi:glycosyltransferase involved in cell wall biosynthesis
MHIYGFYQAEGTKTRIAVIHSSLNLPGGAERLSITLMNALMKAGHRVTLITTDKTNWPLLQDRHGLTCPVDQEHFVHPTSFMTPSMTSKALWTLTTYLVKSPLVKAKTKYDITINTSGEVINVREDIAYVNAVPMRAAYLYPDVLPIQTPWWRYGSQVYDLLLKPMDQVNKNTLFVTNSTFLEAILNRKLRRQARVVYPPVDVGSFRPLSRRRERENLVVTVSRFRPGKNLEAIPAIAQHVKVRFVIIGPSDPGSETTIKKIHAGARRLKVQDRIQLRINEPRSVLFRIVSEAKVLLHTQFYEAFGMAVVEAMAAGCVPIVPERGGPWIDILDQKQGRYGYAYGSAKEAADRIQGLLEDEGLRRGVAARACTRAEAFTPNIFTDRMLQIVEEAHVRKERHQFTTTRSMKQRVN